VGSKAQLISGNQKLKVAPSRISTLLLLETTKIRAALVIRSVEFACRAQRCQHLKLQSADLVTAGTVASNRDNNKYSSNTMVAVPQKDSLIQQLNLRASRFNRLQRLVVAPNMEPESKELFIPRQASNYSSPSSSSSSIIILQVIPKLWVEP